MSVNFEIAYRKTNGNLHVSPMGDFDGSSAWELINLLHEQYDGKGRVVIDTNKLRKIFPFGCSTFRCRLNKSKLPANRLYFKGTKGYDIVLEGSKVIEAPEKHQCKCNGNCAIIPAPGKTEKIRTK